MHRHALAGRWGVLVAAFAVEYGAAERQLAQLEVFAVDASGGEGFPPRDVAPLILEAPP